MSAVSAINLIIQKGTYFEETFALNAEDESALNLINQLATAKLKKHPTAGIAHTFSTSVTVATGTIKISMSPEQTAVLPSGRCVYDILLTKNGTVTKVVEGTVLVQETVSL